VNIGRYVPAFPGHLLLPSSFSFTHSSMALQPFIGLWLHLQFRNLFYTVGRTPWTGDPPIARPLPNTNTE
jgi:hypothetical protein